MKISEKQLIGIIGILLMILWGIIYDGQKEMRSEMKSVRDEMKDDLRLIRTEQWKKRNSLKDYFGWTGKLGKYSDE